MRIALRQSTCLAGFHTAYFAVSMRRQALTLLLRGARHLVPVQNICCLHLGQVDIALKLKRQPFKHTYVEFCIIRFLSLLL